MYIFDWPCLSYFFFYNFLYVAFVMYSTMGYLIYCRDGVSVGLFFFVLFCEQLFVLNFLEYEVQGL